MDFLSVFFIFDLKKTMFLFHNIDHIQTNHSPKTFLHWHSLSLHMMCMVEIHVFPCSLDRVLHSNSILGASIHCSHHPNTWSTHIGHRSHIPTCPSCIQLVHREDSFQNMVHNTLLPDILYRLSSSRS